jgi:hypothetical protein
MDSEIEAFLEVPGPIVLVTFGGCDFTKALWYPRIAGIASAPEIGGQQTLGSGTPSADVLSRIRNAVGYWNRNVRIRVAARTGVIVFVLAAAAAGLAAWEAERQVARAALASAAAHQAQELEADATRKANAASTAIAAQDLLANSPRSALKSVQLAVQSLSVAKTSWGEFVARNAMSLTPRFLSRRELSGLGEKHHFVPKAFPDQVAQGPNGLFARWGRIERSGKFPSFTFELENIRDPTAKNSVELAGFISDVKFPQGGVQAVVMLSGNGGVGDEKSLTLVRAGGGIESIAVHGIVSFSVGPNADQIVVARTDVVELWRIGVRPQVAKTWMLSGTDVIAVSPGEGRIYALAGDGVYLLEDDARRIATARPPVEGKRRLAVTRGHVITNREGAGYRSFDLRSGKWDHEDLEYGEVAAVGDERILIRKEAEVIVHDLSTADVNYYSGALSLKCPRDRDQDVLVTSIGLSGDGRTVALGCATGLAAVARMTGGLRIAIAPLEDTRPLGLWLDEAGGVLDVYAVGQNPARDPSEGEATQWEITNKCTPAIESLDGVLALAPGGAAVAELSERGLRILDPKTGELMFQSLPAQGLFALTIPAISKDGRNLANAGMSNLELIHFLEKGEAAAIKVPSLGEPLSAAFGGATGTELAVTMYTRDGSAQVLVGGVQDQRWQEHFRTATGVWTRHVFPDNIMVSPVAISPSGDVAYLAPSGEKSSEADFQRMKTVRVRRTDGSVSEVSLSSAASALQFQNDELVIGTRSGDIVAWRPSSESRQQPRLIGHHDDMVLEILSGDEDYIAAVDAADVFRMWRTGTGLTEIGRRGYMESPLASYGISNYSELGVRGLSLGRGRLYAVHRGSDFNDYISCWVVPASVDLISAARKLVQ